MCSGVCGAVLHRQSSVSAGQGAADESQDGSVQYEGRRWWSVGSMTGDASGHQMVDNSVCILF